MFILSLLTWLEIVICFIIFWPIQFTLLILTFLFDKHKKVMHYHSAFCAWIGLLLSLVWKIKVTGKENIDKKQTYVAVMNHQSYIDGLLTYTIGIPLKMTAKYELGLVPILGWNMIISGYIMVKRNNSKSQFNAISKMEEYLRNGDSLMIFPEGTRTKDGEIAEFKKGAFRSAIKTGTPILPVVIDGPYQLLPRTGFIVDKVRTIHIHILPPISVSQSDNITELKDKTREIMKVELAEMRKTVTKE